MSYLVDNTPYFTSGIPISRMRYADVPHDRIYHGTPYNGSLIHSNAPAKELPMELYSAPAKISSMELFVDPSATIYAAPAIDTGFPYALPYYPRYRSPYHYPYRFPNRRSIGAW